MDGEAEESDRWWREGDKVSFSGNRAPSVPQALRWGPGPHRRGPTQPLPSRSFPTGGTQRLTVSVTRVSREVLGT